MREDALERFAGLGERLGMTPEGCAPLAHELVARYGEPHRRYHTVAHVLDCLERAAEVRGQLGEPELVEMALWFHDVVYDPRASDSEVKSAVVARERLTALALPADKIGRVVELVLVTAAPASAPPGDAALLCDIDFSILGRAWPDYDAYRRAIREEYAFVPDDGFRAGRGRLLREWLERPRLFHTEAFRGRYEATARENLARELAELSPSGLH